MATDHLGDPVGAPQLVMPTMGPGPLQQQPLQLPDLFVGQPRLGSGMGCGGQGLGGLLGHGEPAIQGGATDAEDAGNDGGRLAPLHQFDGTSSSSFQFVCGSDRSHTYTTTGTAERFLWPGWGQ